MIPFNSPIRLLTTSRTIPIHRNNDANTFCGYYHISNDNDNDNDNSNDNTFDKSAHTTNDNVVKFFNVIGISNNFGSNISPPNSHI